MARPRVAVLSADDAGELLKAKPAGILVGGMALAFWARYFGVEPPSALSAGVTSDIDLLGSASDAERFAKRLAKGGSGQVELFRATLADATPNSAKVVVRGFRGRPEPVEIDYLAALHGFDHAAEQRLRNRALPIEFDRSKIEVMHPLDCVRSRVHNLDSLPGKRGRAAVAQCRLATSVARAYLVGLCESDGNAHKREGYRAVEQIIALAASAAGVRVHAQHRIDLLKAVPAELFGAQFRAKRWPRAVAHVDAKRRAWARRNTQKTRGPPS